MGVTERDIYQLTEQLMRADEATTMSSIAYLPSTLGAVKGSIHSLAKMKRDWDVSFNEDAKWRNVDFEGDLRVRVPLQYWGDFTKNFGMIKGAGKVDLSSLLKEAVEEDLDFLRKDLKPYLVQLYGDPMFIQVDKQTNLWKANFGVTERYETKSAVSVESKEKDIQFIVTKLLKVYGNDRGGMEMILTAIQEKQVLSSFSIFNKFDFLYGTKFLSTYRDVKLIYESLIDMSYQFSQSVLIDPKYPDIIYAIEDLHDASIQIVKNVLYPVGSVFKARFLKDLKNIVRDNIE
jgi:hypothetical protein